MEEREKKRPWVFLLAEGHPAECWLQARLDPLPWLDSHTHTHLGCLPSGPDLRQLLTHTWLKAYSPPTSCFTHTPTPANTPHSQRASCPTRNNPDHVRPSTTHWHCVRWVWWEGESVCVSRMEWEWKTTALGDHGIHRSLCVHLYGTKLSQCGQIGHMSMHFGKMGMSTARYRVTVEMGQLVQILLYCLSYGRYISCEYYVSQVMLKCPIVLFWYYLSRSLWM